MDDFNNSLNHGASHGTGPSRNGPTRNPFVSQLTHPARLERLRRTVRARTSEALEARRRRPRSVLAGEDSRSESSSATASPGKRRKIEQHPAQIHMAQLDLELAYCDGGKYKKTNTKPESVLNENDEVYCTRGSHCNMIFQHVGAKCFTLEEMVIQGPSFGYTSPVQEGIIFVAMNKDDLISGCKYLFRMENQDNEDNDDDDDDDDEDENELEESDDDDDLNDQEFPLLEPCDHPPTTSALREPTSNFFQFIDRPEGGTPSARVSEIKPIEPSIRFKIRRDDRGNKRLKFEPALSGRFILARFFSPSRRENIDIQFIGAYGYVGRRFFPAVTVR